MPPSDSGSGGALVNAFRAVAQKKGSAAAIQWLLNAKTAGPLQALVKTPHGRAALAVAALGFSAGWVGGSNAPKIQALATALKSVADQRLPPMRAAQQIVEVLQAATTSRKTATLVAPDRTAAKRQVQSLFTSLKGAQADLKVTEQLLKQRPGDQDLQVIFSGQKAKVLELQRKLNALGQGRTTPQPAAHRNPPRPHPSHLPSRIARRRKRCDAFRHLKSSPLGFRNKFAPEK